MSIDVEGVLRKLTRDAGGARAKPTKNGHVLDRFRPGLFARLNVTRAAAFNLNHKQMEVLRATVMHVDLETSLGEVSRTTIADEFDIEVHVINKAIRVIANLYLLKIISMETASAPFQYVINQDLIERKLDDERYRRKQFLR